MKQQVEVIESQISEQRRKPNNKHGRRAAVITWAKAGHCDNKDSEVIHIKKKKNKTKYSRYVGLYGVTQRLKNHRERERARPRQKGEETGKSHLIVWNKKEPPSVFCSSTQCKPHFLTQMLTDCAVNHANESRTARGLMFTVPLGSHQILECHVSRGTSSAVIAVSGSNSVLLRHFLAEILLLSGSK